MHPGYRQATRHPAPCLCLVLPLLLAYEGGMQWLAAQGGTPLRTGLDVWLNFSLTRLGAPWPWAPSAAVAAIVIGWAALTWRGPTPDLPGAVLGMVVESLLAALLLWGLFCFQQPLLKACGLAVGSGRTRFLFAQSLSFVGAGLFEETLFRLLLFTALLGALRLAFAPWLAAAGAALLSAGAFAAAHHFGPQGELWNQGVFLFRVFAGAYFVLLCQFRGFGVAVGAHVAYDVLIGFAHR